MNRKAIVSWRNFFLVWTRILHFAEAVSHPSAAQIGAGQGGEVDAGAPGDDDGLGAIYPAMANAIVALRCLGYSEDDPQVIRARERI